MGSANDGEIEGIESLKNFERALGHVRNSARPLTLISREEVGACIGPADRAKLNLQLAYGVTSLFYMFLRTQGISPSTHPVKAELDRIRGYFGRLQNVGKPPKQPTLKVDKEASRRFINSALAGDSVWQDGQRQSLHGKAEQVQQRSNDPGIGRSEPAGEPEDADASDVFTFVGIPLGKRKHGGDGRFWGTTGDKGDKKRKSNTDGKRKSKTSKRGKNGSR